MLTIGAASAFAPNAAFTRSSSAMFMADGDVQTGSVKWYVFFQNTCLVLLGYKCIFMMMIFLNSNTADVSITILSLF